MTDKLTTSTKPSDFHTLHRKLGTLEHLPQAKTLKSPYPVEKTIARIEAIIKNQGGTIFAVIDQSEAAAGVGLELLPIKLLLAGNPLKGTSLIQDNPAIAFDLPLRFLAAEDASGQVWLCFTNPLFLSQTYAMSEASIAKLKQMAEGIQRICEQALSAE